ncbi:MAG: hypothetical protein GAK35_01066 [Herbaspirillum frisingense]|uniref:Uncharacterized protein n=1 Tax=Herbaspirillum frisingense TaxID=92645 RepID=A0A7V8FYU0_9BURK|nr:MAG: hypothetical protein GAK35_01066 [Herbaspirillum frisingense]
MSQAGFTYNELGALLAAAGTVMYERGLCGGAALDGDSHEQIKEILAKEFHVEEERADVLLTLTIEQAVGYLDPDGRPEALAG